MLIVNARIQVPLAEFVFTYSRSGGPGGQNVNKVNSKATLRWKVSTTPSLPEAVRARFLALFPTRITVEGELVVHSQLTRDAPVNAQDCLEKVAAMIQAAAFVPKVRRVTKPSRGSIERRHEAKRRNSERKSGRRPGAHDD